MYEELAGREIVIKIYNNDSTSYFLIDELDCSIILRI